MNREKLIPKRIMKNQSKFGKIVEGVFSSNNLNILRFNEFGFYKCEEMSKHFHYMFVRKEIILKIFS